MSGPRPDLSQGGQANRRKSSVAWDREDSRGLSGFIQAVGGLVEEAKQ
jgi:hypothetical protein